MRSQNTVVLSVGGGPYYSTTLSAYRAYLGKIAVELQVGDKVHLIELDPDQALAFGQVLAAWAKST